MPRTLVNDVRVTLRLPGEIREEIEKLAETDGVGASEWMREALELMTQASLGKLGRLSGRLVQSVRRVAELADLTPEEWIWQSLEMMAASDLKAYESIEVSKFKAGAVQIPDRCAHLLQYRRQGVFDKYCDYCGTRNPL